MINKKLKWKGSSKIDKKTNNFIDYKDFAELIENNKYNEINHKGIYIQKLFANYQINKKILNYVSINKNFVTIFWINHKK